MCFLVGVERGQSVHVVTHFNLKFVGFQNHLKLKVKFEVTSQLYTETRVAP